VHDRLTGSTVRVSVDSNGLEGNDHSFSPSISGDGTLVAFISFATNLVPGDMNGRIDVFFRNISAGTTTRVSQGLNGAEANDHSLEPSISPDGGFVAFRSQADNLVQGDTNGQSDVFVYDLTQNTTVRVSVGAGGVEGNNGSFIPSISSGGGAVAFESFATNLVEGDTNGHEDVFVRVLR
jgi:Tol biopolymer transport system component